jgi:hypothetical protein
LILKYVEISSGDVVLSISLGHGMRLSSLLVTILTGVHKQAGAALPILGVQPGFPGRISMSMLE